MPELMNIANPSALTESLNRAMRRSRRDPRVSDWMKKKARNWLLRREDNNGFEIVPGSSLEGDLPDWAKKARAEGRPLHYFAMSASADDMLRHIDDFFSDLLSYESGADEQQAEMAKKVLDSLNHREVKDAYEQADRFYEELAASSIKGASRSRKAVFAVQQEDGPTVEYKAENGLAWKQVTPRGLKTVAVVLSNCLGGAHYAADVRTGRAEIWCLVNDVPDEDFNHDRDILAAAHIRSRDRHLVEFNGPNNRSPVQYIDALEEFSVAHSFDARHRINMLSRGTVSKNTFERNYQTYAQRDGVYLVAEYMGRGIDKLMMEGVRSYDFGIVREVDGRMKIETLGSIALSKDKRAVVNLKHKELNEALTSASQESVLIDGLTKLLEGVQVIGVTAPAKGYFANENTDAKFAEAFDKSKAPARALEADLLFDDAFRLNPWTRDIVYSDSTDDAEMRVSSSGVTQLYDMDTEKSLVMLGSPRIAHAASSAAAQMRETGRQISRASWKNMLKEAPRPTNGNVKMLASGSLTEKMFTELCALDQGGVLVTPQSQYSTFEDYEHRSFQFSLPYLTESQVRVTRDMIDIRIKQCAKPVLQAETGVSIEKSRISGGYLYQVVEGDERHDLLMLKAGISGSHFDFAATPLPLVAKLPLSAIRDLASDLEKSGASFDDTSRHAAFVGELFRPGIGGPTDLRNVGTDEHPVIKLDRPKRLVGIIPGKDGSIENGFPAWMVMPKPRGEVVLRHVTEEGLEHLRQTALDKHWQISISRDGKAEETVRDAGWNVAQGVLMRRSNPEIDALESPHFRVRREYVYGVEDRVFMLVAKTPPEDPSSFEHPHISFGADLSAAPGTPKIVLTSSIREDRFAEATALIAEGFNLMKIKPTLAQRQFFGLTEDEAGKLRPDGRDPLQGYAVSDGYHVRRTPYAICDDPYRTSGNDTQSWWLMDSKDLVPEATSPLATYDGSSLSIRKVDPDVIRAAAEMVEALQQDRLFDCPLETAPTPKNT